MRIVCLLLASLLLGASTARAGQDPPKGKEKEKKQKYDSPQATEAFRKMKEKNKDKPKVLKADPTDPEVVKIFEDQWGVLFDWEQVEPDDVEPIAKEWAERYGVEIQAVTPQHRTIYFRKMSEEVAHEIARDGRVHRVMQACTVRARHRENEHEPEAQVRPPSEYLPERAPIQAGLMALICSLPGEGRTICDPDDWQRDRVDQRLLDLSNPTGLSGTYTYKAPSVLSTTRVFIVDGGVDRNHVEFQGMTTRHNKFLNFQGVETGQGADISYHPGEDAWDHGTCMASVIAGKKYGLYPQAPLIHSLRVLGILSTSFDYRDMAAAIAFAANYAGGKKVIVTSIVVHETVAFHEVTEAAIADAVANHDTLVVVPAPNGNVLASFDNTCTIAGATCVSGWYYNKALKRDEDSPGAYGEPIKIFAPNKSLYCAIGEPPSTTQGHTAYDMGARNGNSYAGPMAAAVLAATWDLDPSLTAAQLTKLVINKKSTQGRLPAAVVGTILTPAPNRMLYSRVLPAKAFSSGSYKKKVAKGSIATAFVFNQEQTDSVLFEDPVTGASHQGAVFFSSLGQVNFSVPAGISEGVAYFDLVGRTDCFTSGECASGPGGFIEVSRIMPDVYTFSGSGSGIATIENWYPQGAGCPGTIQAWGGNCIETLDPNYPAKNAPFPQGGRAVQDYSLVIYATGLRNRNNLADVTVEIWDPSPGAWVPLQVEYAQATPGFEGLDQINARFPSTFPAALRGTLNLRVKVEGQEANAVQVYLRP